MKLVRNHRLYENDITGQNPMDDIFQDKLMDIHLDVETDYDYCFEITLVTLPMKKRQDPDVFFETMCIFKEYIETVFDSFVAIDEMSPVSFTLEPTDNSPHRGSKTRYGVNMQTVRNVLYYCTKNTIDNLVKNNSKISICFKVKLAENVMYHDIMKFLKDLFTVTPRVANNCFLTDKIRIFNLEIYDTVDIRKKYLGISEDRFNKLVNKSSDARPEFYLKNLFKMFISDKRKINEYLMKYNEQELKDTTYTGNIINILKSLGLKMHQMNKYNFYQKDGHYYLEIPENTVMNITYLSYMINERIFDFPEMKKFHIVVNGTLKINCYDCYELEMLIRHIDSPVNNIEIDFILNVQRYKVPQLNIDFKDMEINSFKCKAKLGYLSSLKGLLNNDGYMKPKISFNREPKNKEMYTYIENYGSGKDILSEF